MAMQVKAQELQLVICSSGNSSWSPASRKFERIIPTRNITGIVQTHSSSENGTGEACQPGCALGSRLVNNGLSSFGKQSVSPGACRTFELKSKWTIRHATPAEVVGY